MESYMMTLDGKHYKINPQPEQRMVPPKPVPLPCLSCGAKQKDGLLPCGH